MSSDWQSRASSTSTVTDVAARDAARDEAAGDDAVADGGGVGARRDENITAATMAATATTPNTMGVRGDRDELRGAGSLTRDAAGTGASGGIPASDVAARGAAAI